MPVLHVTSSPVPSSRPPVVLAHGAGNSSVVWRYWQEALAERGWSSHALDLRGHGESEGSVDGATMSDYADDVAAFAAGLPATPVLIGWSMGGLVAMMAAARGVARACVGLAPSTPAAMRDETVAIRPGVFAAVEYGITSRDPVDQPTMPDLDSEERSVAIESLSVESRMARDDRRAGIVITSLPCPLLVVTGSEDRDWPRSAYADMRLRADYAEVRDASHWGLVLNRRALPGMADQVTAWLEAPSRAA